MKQIGNQRIKLECNKPGHYVLPLLPLAYEDCKVIFHLESLFSLSKSEKEKKAVKLHRQFCNPSKERLLNLLKNANCTDKEFLNIIESCTDSCKFCCKYKKVFSKPIVGFPVAGKFNSVVCVDLRDSKTQFYHSTEGKYPRIGRELLVWSQYNRHSIILHRAHSRFLVLIQRYFSVPIKS